MANGKRDDQAEELLPLTDEDRAELGEQDVSATPAEAPAPAEAAGEAAPEVKAEVPAEPAAEAGPKEPAAPAEPETAEQLRERLAKRDREIREMRRRHAREREELRVAAERAEFARQVAAAATPPPAAAPPLAGIPVELGPDGQYRIDAEQLRQAIARTQAPQPVAAAAPPAYRQPAASREVQERAAQYDGWRSQLMTEAPDPGAARSAIEALEEAYTWLDQRTVQAVREAGYMPRNLGELMDFLEGEGVAAEFAAKHPGIEIDELVEAPNDYYKMRRTLSRYMGRASAGAPAPAAAAPSGPSPAKVVAMGDRPRPMALKGRVAPLETKLQRAGNLTAKDVLRMSDDEFREMEDLAKSM